MPVLGDLDTMGLDELLGWAGRNQKTGVLELERNKLCRRVEFRKGWIGACSSSDPASRLGQFLLARGKITEEQLREALAQQQTVRRNLGRILNDMGVLSRKELARQIALKAEETLYGLFEWQDAVFRYHEGATLDPDHIEVSLSVSDILERGRRRVKELATIRQVFGSSGVVLEQTETAAHSEILKRPMVRRILDSIDGERTIAELLLHTNATEFTVLKFLFSLHAKGVVRVRDERRLSAESPTLLDRPQVQPSRVPICHVELSHWATEEETPAVEARAEPPAAAAEPPTGGIDESEELEFEIQIANRLLERDEPEAALELLNAAYRARPDDPNLRRLLTKTEGRYVDAVRRHPLSFAKIPVLLPAAEQIEPEILRPEESFLLSLVDGESDIQSMLWVTPMREVDVLIALRRMLDRGVIGFDAVTPSATDGDTATTC